MELDHVTIKVSNDDKALCTTTAGVASIITRNVRFAVNNGNLLHVWRDGVYKPVGEKLIHEAYKYILAHFDKVDVWRYSKSCEIVNFIRLGVPELWEKPPIDKINLLNGILDVKTRSLSPHVPEFLSTIQLPVNYQSLANCVKWDKFVCEVFPADSYSMAFQLIAWLMIPYTNIQRAILLLGEGANGKSTYLKGVMSFLGMENVCALSLHKLEENRFASVNLLGKLANICPDIPNKKLETTSTFKAITGGDMIMAEYKNGNSFPMRTFARLIFSANEMPPSSDETLGWYRRLIIVPFDKTFDDNPSVGNELEKWLAEPWELSGVLNRALDYLPNIVEHGFKMSRSVKDAIDEVRPDYKLLFRDWVKDNLVSSDANVSTMLFRDLYNRFVDYCEEFEFGKPTKRYVAGMVRGLGVSVRVAHGQLKIFGLTWVKGVE